MPGVRNERASARRGSRRWRPRAPFLIACAGAGAAINVLVAWGCWFRGPGPTIGDAEPIARRDWPSWIETELPAPAKTVQARTPLITFTATTGGEQAKVTHARWSAGVPLRSMQMEYVNDARAGPPLPIRSHGELRARWLPAAWWATFAAVPGRPIPVGFALNTLVYAGVVGLAASVPGWLRRGRRRRRGLCERCGYPAGVAPVCSECGATLDLAGSRSSA